MFDNCYNMVLLKNEKMNITIISWSASLNDSINANKILKIFNIPFHYCAPKF
jgi:hypothetical protein